MAEDDSSSLLQVHNKAKVTTHDSEEDVKALPPGGWADSCALGMYRKARSSFPTRAAWAQSSCKWNRCICLGGTAAKGRACTSHHAKICAKKRKPVENNKKETKEEIAMRKKQYEEMRQKLKRLAKEDALAKEK